MLLFAFLKPDVLRNVASDRHELGTPTTTAGRVYWVSDSGVYREVPSRLQPPPPNYLKSLIIILNVCYILMVLYAYLEFTSNVKSFRDIL
jgi:hypothetical protein